MSYAGELGWELHGPAENMLAVYEALWAAGEAHGIANYGSFAMNAMRMEKGFKGAGELTNEVTLPEADVMRFVNLETGDFIGRDETIALQQAAAAGTMPWICAYSRSMPTARPAAMAARPSCMTNVLSARQAPVAYGHSVGKVLAFAYIKPEAAARNSARGRGHERSTQGGRSWRGHGPANAATNR